MSVSVALLRAEELNSEVGHLEAEGFQKGRPEATAEEWRAIPSTSGLYEASSEGRVRRAAGTWYRDGAPLVLAQRATNRGYQIVDVTVDGKSTSKTVHRLVAEAFHGPCPAVGHQVDHVNMKPGDNRAANLEWVSPAENTRRRWAKRVRHMDVSQLTALAAVVTVEAERRAVAS